MGSKGSSSSRSSKGIVRLGSFLFSFLLCSNLAAAQSFEGGIHLAASQWSEFDGTDFGLGGRLTWKPTSLIGVDADLTWYPVDFPPDEHRVQRRPLRRVVRRDGRSADEPHPPVRESRRRIPSLVRGTGTVRVHRDLPAAACCCLMATGHTMTAFEIGGGVEVSTRPIATFLRVDVSGSDDRISRAHPSRATSSASTRRSTVTRCASRSAAE